MGGGQGKPVISEPIGPLGVRLWGKTCRRRWEPMLFLPVMLTEPLSPSQPHISPSSIIATGGTRFQKGRREACPIIHACTSAFIHLDCVPGHKAPRANAECVYAKLLQSCSTLCDPKDCSLPGFSVHGISQARILE